MIPPGLGPPWRVALLKALKGVSRAPKAQEYKIRSPKNLPGAFCARLALTL